MKPDYKGFFIEALKIFFFCIGLQLAFALHGATTKELLILLNMAVMSSTATFSIKNEPLSLYIKAALSIAFFTLAGGVLGFYFSFLSKVVFILLAAASYYIPKRLYDFRILLNSSLVFLIFSNIPFSLNDGLHFAKSALIFIASYALFHLIVSPRSQKKDPLFEKSKLKIHKQNALIAMIALSISWLIGITLKDYYTFQYLYWIPLTTLLVLQGDTTNIIKTSFKRIFISAFAAIGSIILFSFVLPNNFLINLFVIFLILFFMFFFRYSYTKRTLFIEIYVLGITYLLGQKTGPIIFERISFTVLGAFIAILTTLFLDRLVFKQVD